MFPDLAQANPTDQFATDSVDGGDLTLTEYAAVSTNSSNIILGEFDTGRSLASGRTCSRSHISEIAGLSSGFEMGRLDTDRTITGVQDMQPVRNGSMEDLVGDYVRSVTTLPAGVCGVDASVAMAEGMPPIPALVSGWVFWHDPAEGLDFIHAPGTHTYTLVDSAGGA